MNLHTVYQESERRLTTVLFADISGFTAMSEKMDPEEVTVLMNRCFLMMERVIEKYGGTVDKFIGDCVMATFGAPSAIENAAQKAVQTALEIQTGLHRFNREKNFEVHLDVHVGINTGTVVAGKVGGDRKREYTVMGDTVNIASRLESISKKGQILVGPDTYNAAKSRFEFRKLKPFSLKGKSEILPVYELLPFQNLIHQKEFTKRSLIFSDLVGRDAEIALLESSLKKLAAGWGGIINLIGEAGIGKSRLVAEVKKKDIWNRMAFLEGRCISIGRNFSFYPFSILLQNWAGINENDNERIAFDKLERSVSAVLGEKTQDALPFIATISGIALPQIYDRRVREMEGEALEILILKSMKELFSKLSLKKPLVILMEDFHWSDKSSTKFLSALYPLSEKFPILFFSVLRPEYDKRIEKMVDEVRMDYPDRYTEIVVQTLTESQSSILINNLMNIPGMPMQVREQILARADGNPFFIEEVVRSFIDIGAVVMKDGYYEITERMKDVSIPHTVNDVVMARIDRLDDRTRELVRIASVIGRSFFHRILSEVAGDEENIGSCLENLKEMQFIRERRRMDEMEYVFKHALAQETAYASILFQKRRDLHRKTAVAIEKVFAGRLNEFYGMLSYHYISSDDMDKAEFYLLKAGEEALKSGASSEAIYYYQEAMGIYVKKFGDKVNPLKMAMIQRQIALSFYKKGQYNEAFECYTKALRCYKIKIPENRFLFLPSFAAAFVNFFISLYFPFLKWKRYPEKHEMEVIELFYYRLATLVYIDSRKFFLESFFFSRYLSKFDLVRIKGGIGMFVGLSVAFSWSAVSFRLSGKILSFVKNRVDEKELGTLLNFELADLFHAYYTGRWDIMYRSSLVEHGLKMGEIMHVSGYITFYGRIRTEQGLYREAREMVRRLSEIGDTYSHDFSRTLKYFLNTQLLMKYRKLPAALIEAEEGIDFISRTDFKQVLMVLHSFKSMIFLYLRDYENAEKSIEEANKIRFETNVVSSYLCHYQMGLTHFEQYKLKTAIADGNREKIALCRKQALSACRAMVKSSKKAASYRTEALRIMGNYYAMTGRERNAIKWWGKSLLEGEHLGARLEVARTCFEIGRNLTAHFSGRLLVKGMAGAEYLERAERMFKEMKLQWDLSKTE